MDKRGFELTINTLIIMIIGIVLLATILLFFTMGSGNFMNTIKSYFSYSNVDSVVSSCNLFADSNQLYRYCCEKNKVKYYVNDSKEEGSFSCKELLGERFVSNLKEMQCAGEC